MMGTQVKRLFGLHQSNADINEEDQNDEGDEEF